MEFAGSPNDRIRSDEMIGGIESRRTTDVLMFPVSFPSIRRHRIPRHPASDIGESMENTGRDRPPRRGAVANGPISAVRR